MIEQKLKYYNVPHTAAFLHSYTGEQERRYFFTLMLRSRDKKALLHKALWVRFSQDKGLIPKPSKSLFYCVTNMQQRS